MARIISASLALLILASALAFAGGSKEAAPSSAQPITVTLAYPGGDIIVNTIKDMTGQFESRYGGRVKVDVVVIPTGGQADFWSTYFNKLQTMISAGNAPDVAQVATEGVLTFVKRGLALPLDSYIKEKASLIEDYSDIAPQLQKAVVIDGKTYALVWGWNNVVMHINTDMLKAAGLPVPPASWSLDDFLRYAKALTVEKDGQKTYGFAIPNYYFGAEGWLYANGTGILNADMTRSALDSPRAVQVIQLFHDMIYKSKLAPVPNPKTDFVNQMVSGQVAMISAGRWPFAAYSASKFTTVAVQYLPLMSEPRTVVFGNGAFPVMSASKHPEEAFELAAFLSGSGFQSAAMKEDSIPSRISVMKKILPGTKAENWQIFMDSVRYGKAVQAPAGFPQIADIFNRYLSEVLSDQMDAQTAMTKASAEINAVLSSQ